MANPIERRASGYSIKVDTKAVPRAPVPAIKDKIQSHMPQHPALVNGRNDTMLERAAPPIVVEPVAFLFILHVLFCIAKPVKYPLTKKVVMKIIRKMKFMRSVVAIAVEAGRLGVVATTIRR